MIEILCPDGSLAQFPDGTSDDAIATALRRQFPPPRPEALQPGEWAHRANGASIMLDATMSRFIVYDAAGTPRGFRLTLDEALDFADALPPPRALRAVKPEPVTVVLPREVSNALVAHEVELHIRQTEGKARRAQRESINQRRRRR